MRLRVLRPTAIAATAVLAALLASGCTGGPDGTGGAEGAADGIVAPQPPERLRVQVLETLPHDQSAFTQGFEIAHGTMYEGTGVVGRSIVRAVDMTTGKELARVLLPEPLFGEGITVAGSSLWQLTWRNGIAIERDPKTLAERRRVRYQGEGWGLCHQAESGRLVMSDGSDVLTFRDPATFETVGRSHIRSGDKPMERLNELECVDDLVYANVWQTDTIVRIDPDAGRVTGEIDAGALWGMLTEDERERSSVLNGIAAIPGSDAFFVTGKYWPKMFRVRFVPR